FATRRSRTAIVAARTAIASAATATTKSAASTTAAAAMIAAAFARRTMIARFARSGQLLFRRRRKKRLARQTNLAGLRFDGDDLHFHFVADLIEIGDLTDAGVRHLADVQQSVLTGKDFDERSVRLDALHCPFVVLPDVRRCGQSADDVERALGRLAVGRRHGHLAVILDVDLRSGFFDDPANGLAARSDDVANALLPNV